MAKIEIPKFADREELFDFLVDNKEIHIKQKKDEVKHADAFENVAKRIVDKAHRIDPDDVDVLKTRLVINTTKIMDSHSDVHIDNLWRKSLRENKGFYLLQEHQMKFDKIISDPDQTKASAEIMSWKSLGFGRFKGDTQALVFNSEIHKDRNPFMFDQYAKGFVKNHSVGMRYVNLFLAINSDSDGNKEEKEVWDKYFPITVNQKTIESQGFFWAVTEAKALEGSAVVKGSNFVTPTLEIEAKDIEPSSGTQKTEPSQDTPKRNKWYY